MKITLDQQREQIARLNSFKTHISFLFFGTYVGFHGMKSMPVNRILFILDAPKNSGSYFADKHDKFPIRTNAVYFLPQGHPSDLLFNPGIEYFSIHFSCEIYPGLELFSEIDRILCMNALELTARARRICECLGEKPLCTTLEINALLAEALARLFPELPQKVQKAERQWNQFQSIISSFSIPEPSETRIDHIASRLGMSRESFTRKFTRQFGISPKKFLNRQLFRKAAELMLTPGMTAREAAAILHFRDEFYFSRFFKKYAGMSPREFSRNSSV